ncbi:MAG TPA: ergothioneine biosynthesis protein EgtB [Polyangiales bacterium]|nr:ergothioneine biosynthesis protein EgtB [Polyangiales bacterium]
MTHDRLASDFSRVRAQTEALAAPLSDEDQCVQSMADASPTKWHRAHTTWFYETFVLGAAGIDGLSPSAYAVLFNSYYNTVGAQYHRPSRGLLSRPSADDVSAYRQRVDAAVLDLLAAEPSAELLRRVEVGLHHEQQHQELILTDIKDLFSCNPLEPSYIDRAPDSGVRSSPPPMRWQSNEGGVVSIGCGPSRFHFDNEGPVHEVLLRSFELGQRLVTNAEYLAFIDDGGYERPELWLSAGWDTVQKHGWQAPRYWRRDQGSWSTFTLRGRREVRQEEPVVHVSYYEADAYARWSGSRLPTEQECEAANSDPEPAPLCGREPLVHPTTPSPYGAAWQWTSSSYSAYPRYRTAEGALGEYNGKFMCGQYVLRGSSSVTPVGHSRRTYRNFFPPEARWQFSGIRLARDGG